VRLTLLGFLTEEDYDGVVENMRLAERSLADAVNLSVGKSLPKARLARTSRCAIRKA